MEPKASNGTGKQEEKSINDKLTTRGEQMVLGDLNCVFNALQETYKYVSVIDVRSQADFNKSNVIESINIPNKPNKDKSKNEDVAIISKIIRQLSSRWMSAFIFITDQNISLSNNNTTNDESKDIISHITHIKELIESYLHEQLAQSFRKRSMPTFYILQTTYNQFFERYPFLCKDDTNNNNDSNNSSNTELERSRPRYPNAIIEDRLYLGDGFDATNSWVVKDLKITHIVNCTRTVDCAFEAKDPKEDGIDQTDHLFFEPQASNAQNNQNNTNSADLGDKQDTQDTEDTGMTTEEKEDDLPIIEYCRIPISDISTEQIGWYFHKAVAFIAKVLDNKDNSNNNNNNSENDGNNGNKNRILIHCVAGISRSATITIAYLMYSKKWRWKEAYAFVASQRPVIEPNGGFVTYLEAWDKKLFERKSVVANKSIDMENAGIDENESESDEDEQGHTMDLNEYNSVELFNVLQAESNVVIFDIRAKDAFDKCYLKGLTVNIPVGFDFDSELDEKTNTTVFDEIRESMLEMRFKNSSNNNNNNNNNENYNYGYDSSNSYFKPRIVFITDLKENEINLMKAMLNNDEWFVHITNCMQYININSLLPSCCPLFYLAKIDFNDSFSNKYPFLCNFSENNSQTKGKYSSSIKNNYPSMMIEDKLFLGNYHHATRYEILKDLEITHIVNCTNEIDNKYEKFGLISFNRHLSEVNMDDIVNEMIFDRTSDETMDNTDNNNNAPNKLMIDTTAAAMIENEEDEEEDNIEKKINENVGKARKIMYHKIGIYDDSRDNELSVEKLENAIKFVKNGIEIGPIGVSKLPSKVLIHCNKGRSRSVAVIMAYFMKEQSMSLDDALEYVKKRRFMAEPNQHMLKALETFEKSLQK